MTLSTDRRTSIVSTTPKQSDASVSQRNQQRSDFAYDFAGNLFSASSGVYGIPGDEATRATTSLYTYTNYDVRGRAEDVSEFLDVNGASKSMSFKYDYKSDGYTVTANAGTSKFTNVYRFDALAREVFASQDASGQFLKEVTHQYLADGKKPDGAVSYSPRRDVLTRTQKTSSYKTTTVATTTIYYEEQDSQLV